MFIGKGRDAYRDIYGKREGMGMLIGKRGRDAYRVGGCTEMPIGMPTRRWKDVKDMLVRISMGRGIAYGDDLRDAHRMHIRMSMRSGMDAYCDACKDAYRQGEPLGIL